MADKPAKFEIGLYPFGEIKERKYCDTSCKWWYFLVRLSGFQGWVMEWYLDTWNEDMKEIK